MTDDPSDQKQHKHDANQIREQFMRASEQLQLLPDPARARLQGELIEWIDGFRPNGVFWDIGANVGLCALYAALRPYMTADILAGCARTLTRPEVREVRHARFFRPHIRSSRSLGGSSQPQPRVL
jgi:hypothetical protein